MNRVLDTTGAAGSGTSTARDMTRFLAMLLNHGTFEGRRVLQAETVAQMFKRSMVADIEFTEMPPISEATGFYYGLGVDSYDYAGHQISSNVMKSSWPCSSRPNGRSIR